MQYGSVRVQTPPLESATYCRISPIQFLMEKSHYKLMNSTSFNHIVKGSRLATNEVGLRVRLKALQSETDHGRPPGLTGESTIQSNADIPYSTESFSEDEYPHDEDPRSVHSPKKSLTMDNLEHKPLANSTLGRPSRSLIVLDLNGVLCYRHHCSKKVMRQLPKFDLEYFRVGTHIVYLRPFAKEFIKFCLDNYHLGFLTSATRKNAEPILKRLIPKEDWHKVKFFWYRDHTHADPDIGTNPLTPNHSTIKTIKDILASKEINPDGIYNHHNVIICDDSKRKLRFVHPKNYILVEPFNLNMMIGVFQAYNCNPIDGELLRLISRLHRRVYGMLSPMCSITRNRPAT